MKKVLLWIVGIALLAGVFVVQDWYRFAKYGEIDPQRGVYGNDHLEVWIDINARMPAPMRKWACKTLLDREAEIIGGVGRAPYGCDPDFDPNAEGPPMSQSLIEADLRNAVGVAESQGATAEQISAIKACMQTEFVAKVTPEQIEGLDGTFNPETMREVGAMGQAAGEACRKASGLE